MSAQAMQDEDLIILSNDNNDANDLLNFSFDDTTVSSGDMISFDNPTSNTSTIELFDDIKADTVGDLFGETIYDTPSVVNNSTVEPSSQEETEEIDLFGDISSKIDSEVVVGEITPIVSNLEESPKEEKKEEVKEFIQTTEVSSQAKLGFDRNTILDETISKLGSRVIEIDSILKIKQNEVSDIESQIEELNKLKKEKNSQIKDFTIEKDFVQSDIEALNQMKEGVTKKTKAK